MKNKRDNIKKTKISISTQFALIFVSLTIGAILLFLIVNSTLLEDFYIRNKEQALKSAHERIVMATDNSTIESESFDKELDAIALRYNIEIMVVDVDSRTVSYKGDNQEATRLAIWDRMFNTERSTKKGNVIEQTQDYQLLMTSDTRSGFEYIEMWGFLSNDNIFLIRSALQPIHESARITNLFLMYVGGSVIILGSIIVLVVSKKVTKPILELADISERMGELDFEAKYSGKHQNEIGLLGDNINKMSNTLETTISELKVANLELKRDIENRDRIEEMRSEFLSNVSHELKTPLAIIQGYAEGLSEGISDDKESRDYYCSVICDEAVKMNTMVKKLLTLNEMEFGKDNLQMVRFDIVMLIKNRIQAAQLLAKQNDYSIIFSENEPIYVWGDEFKTEEVLNNYISNGINHCSKEKKIVITVSKVDNNLRVNVYNSGENIPDESLEYLFDKFYKVDKARTRDYGGSGIGLSIVKAIQDSMNQGYGVKNEEDGVSFWFDIELA